ncbi:MAG: hypothetical protein AB8D52_03825 [Gammaproteobacteria bacterium]
MNMIFKGKTKIYPFYILILAIFVAGCASSIPEPHQPSDGHISVDPKVPDTASDEIPKIVEQKAFLPPPLPQPVEQDLERYTVVVNDVPVKELLFALARDASLNIDVDSNIEGFVTLNAVEQTLPQILERISRQAKLRYELEGNNLYISPDDPYFRTYKVDYVNISRDTDGEISISTQIANTGTVDVTSTGAGSNGQNNSTTAVKSESLNHFWATLANNISGILGESSSATSGSGQLGSDSVIVNAESGVINVKATSLQHLDIQTFIDQVLQNAQRQVLIEATIVEVTLNDRFQAGVDWSALIGGNNIIQIGQTLTNAFDATDGIFQATIQSDTSTTDADFRATIQLLNTFGDAKVLSSPKLMTLNNQTAVLKVVENEVYFTIDSQISQSTSIAGQNLQAIESEVHTIPVGLVMAVTPQINENQAVTLNVRPTISRIIARIQDPAPQLIAAQSNITNFPSSLIPVIAVREMESILKVNSGQVAILGGLMTDNYDRTTNGVPGLEDAPVVGNAFKQRDFQNTKSELIIFLRPVVIHNASLTGDLAPYRRYLHDNVTTPLPVPK